jgi:hypothetical protein
MMMLMEWLRQPPPLLLLFEAPMHRSAKVPKSLSLLLTGAREQEAHDTRWSLSLLVTGVRDQEAHDAGRCLLNRSKRLFGPSTRSNTLGLRLLGASNRSKRGGGHRNHSIMIIMVPVG